MKCLNCKKSIKKKEKYVNIKTFKDGKEIENTFFHFSCWIDYFNKRIELKTQELLKKAMPNALNIIKGMFQ